MKATDIEVGIIYRLTDSSRVKVLEIRDKSRWDHYRNFKVEYMDRPESLPHHRRTGVVSSREFFREWGEEDDENRRRIEEKTKERELLREEEEATEHELMKAGFDATVTLGLESERCIIGFQNRESFDKMLELLMERTRAANA